MAVALAMIVRDPPLARLAALVALVQPIISECVIVDTGSPAEIRAAMSTWDQTRVMYRGWLDDFSWARNEGLVECQADWTLVLDPDELPSVAMLEHIGMVDRGEIELERDPLAWLYWTRNWWDGLLGPEMRYHWHCRLFRTGLARFYRPIHELVEIRPVGGDTWLPEHLTRDTWIMGSAPRDAYLIHSKGADEIARADALYAKLGANSSG